MNLSEFERAGRLLADLQWVRNDSNFSVNCNVFGMRGSEKRCQCWENAKRDLDGAISAMLRKERERYQAAIIAELSTIGVEGQL